MAKSETGLVDSGLEILDESECIRLLNTASIGRVAVNLGEATAILPAKPPACTRGLPGIAITSSGFARRSCQGGASWAEEARLLRRTPPVPATTGSL